MGGNFGSKDWLLISSHWFISLLGLKPQLWYCNSHNCGIAIATKQMGNLAVFCSHIQRSSMIFYLERNSNYFVPVYPLSLERKTYTDETSTESKMVPAWSRTLWCLVPWPQRRFFCFEEALRTLSWSCKTLKMTMFHSNMKWGQLSSFPMGKMGPSTFLAGHFVFMSILVDLLCTEGQEKCNKKWRSSVQLCMLWKGHFDLVFIASKIFEWVSYKLLSVLSSIISLQHQ